MSKDYRGLGRASSFHYGEVAATYPAVPDADQGTSWTPSTSGWATSSMLSPSCVPLKTTASNSRGPRRNDLHTHTVLVVEAS